MTSAQIASRSRAKAASAAAPVRVALVTPPLDASGGVGRIMSYLLDALPVGRVDVRILDTRGRSSSPVLSILPLLASCARLVALGATRRIDVVHANIGARGSTVRKSLVVWTARALRLPVVLHLHASSYPEFYDALPRRVQALVRRTFAAADRVVVLGSTWRAYAREVLHVDEAALVVLPNAVPGPAEETPAERDAAAPFRILFLGRLGERKGVPELLEALASDELRPLRWHATLAGDGDIDHYRAEAARLGLEDRIELPGWVDTAASAALLQRADVLVLPSHAEGLPISVLEALAHGVPVVTTDVGALPDAVRDGVEGLVVRPGDAEGLAVALRRLCTDEPLRLELARGARRTWAEGFAMQPYAERLAGLWQDVAQDAA